jgi:hypothetical protein
VERHQADVGQGRSCGDAACDRVWDIVKLQVQEYPEAQVRELLDGSRTLGGKELAADFAEAGCAAESPRQCAGRPDAANIQGND